MGKIYTKTINTISFFIQDIYFVAINPFPNDCIHLHLNYIPVNLFHLLTIEACFGDQSDPKTLAPQINLNSDIKENTVHKYIPIQSKMDLIRVEMKKLVILGEHILSFTLLCF